MEIEDIREERRNALYAWQRSYNMEPRPDSSLTTMFINGELNMPVDQVARELMCTDFLYKHTLYGNLLEEFLRKVAHRIKDQYKISWTATWNIVRFYGPIAMKVISLLQSAQHIPPFLPIYDSSGAMACIEGQAHDPSSASSRATTSANAP